MQFQKNLNGYAEASMANLTNQMRWSQDKALRKWMHESRLDGFGKLVSAIDPSDTEKMAILCEMRKQAMAAMSNAPKLLAA